MVTEFSVYSKLIDLLKKESWQIICASPASGTNNRYRKCLLPRRDLHGSEKGPRDEVDLMAHDGKIILIIECKPRLSESMRIQTNLSESDYTKLKRIAKSFPPPEMAKILYRLSGLAIPSNPLIALALAVGIVDCEMPPDVTIFEFGSSEQRIREAGPLVGRFTHT
jgi:hypothetical protein